MATETEPWESLPDIMEPGEVAAIFGVDVKTVTRWAKAGKLKCFHTLGGHRRYRKQDVIDALEGRQAHR